MAALRQPGAVWSNEANEEDVPRGPSRDLPVGLIEAYSRDSASGSFMEVADGAAVECEWAFWGEQPRVVAQGIRSVDLRGLMLV